MFVMSLSFFVIHYIRPIFRGFWFGFLTVFFMSDGELVHHLNPPLLPGLVLTSNTELLNPPNVIHRQSYNPFIGSDQSYLFCDQGLHYELFLCYFLHWDFSFVTLVLYSPFLLFQGIWRVVYQPIAQRNLFLRSCIVFAIYQGDTLLIYGIYFTGDS